MRFGYLWPCRGLKIQADRKLFLSIYSNGLLLASLPEATSLLTFAPEEYSSNIELTMSAERSKSVALCLGPSFSPTWLVDSQLPPPSLCSAHGVFSTRAALTSSLPGNPILCGMLSPCEVSLLWPVQKSPQCMDPAAGLPGCKSSF